MVHGDPPQLTSNNNGVENIFTIDFINFVNLCLMKDEAVRPKYTKLLEHPFIVTRYSPALFLIIVRLIQYFSENEKLDMAGYVTSILDR